MAQREKTEVPSVRCAARRLYLATVGAFAVAGEEADKFVDKLVDKGQAVEEEGRQLVRDRVEERREAAKEFEQQVDERIEAVLERLNVPTKADIRDLNERVTQLSNKVDELTKSQTAEEG